MKIFSGIDSYIRSDTLFKELNFMSHREIPALVKEEDFEKIDIKKLLIQEKLYENNELNPAKMLAIKQYIEDNREKIGGKLEFLQKSILKEFDHEKMNEKLRQSGISTVIKEVRDRIKGKTLP